MSDKIACKNCRKIVNPDGYVAPENICWCGRQQALQRVREEAYSKAVQTLGAVTLTTADEVVSCLEAQRLETPAAQYRTVAAGTIASALNQARQGAAIAECKECADLVEHANDLGALLLERYDGLVRMQSGKQSGRQNRPGAKAVRPICSRCNDTHHVTVEDPERGESRVQMCTSCPVPCQDCRKGGIGPFCESTPCTCSCHGRTS